MTASLLSLSSISVSQIKVIWSAADSVGAAAAGVKRVDYFVPELGEGAEIIEGSTEEKIEKLIEMLKAKGGIK